MSTRLQPILSLALILATASCTAREPQQPVQQDPQEQQAPPPAAEPEFATIDKTGDPAIDALADFVAEAKIDVKSPGWKTNLKQPPQVTFGEGKTYYWNLTTNVGPVKVKLHHDTAPMHASSTMYLTLLGYYDGISFHRVIPGFMAQGGCPLGTGSGGPGYKYDGEFFVRCPNAECGKEYFGEKRTTILGNEYFVCPNCEKSSAPLRRHDHKGILSMANNGPETDGSQFFLTFKATPWLDGKHTIFGEVVDGEDTLTALEEAGTQSGKTLEPLEITSATISVE